MSTVTQSTNDEIELLILQKQPDIADFLVDPD